MGRASKEEAARTRVRIVETACELFRVSGVEQVSVADVMGALGMTTGGFYKHFVSKDALVVEALDMAFERASTSWRAAREGAEDGTRGARGRLVAHYLRARPSPQRCPMIAFASHVTGDEACDASREAYQAGVGSLLAQFVGDPREPRAEGASPAPEREALVLFAAMVGARVLDPSAGDSEWGRALRAAILEAAR